MLNVVLDWIDLNNPVNIIGLIIVGTIYFTLMQRHLFYLYLFESTLNLDSIFNNSPYSSLYLNVGLNGVSNLVFDNSLFIIAILFFVVGMININEMFSL